MVSVDDYQSRDELRHTHAFTKTRATSLPFAAAGPALRSFDSEVAIVAELPTKFRIAVTGGTMNCKEFEPEPHLYAP
jgi:hypothetical protein